MHPVKCQLEALLAALMVTIASSFPTGAPQSACGDLLPIHEDTEAQVTPPPFFIVLSSSNYTSHEPIQVKVKGLETFLAFMLQGRTLGGKPVGRFSQPPPHARLQTCYVQNDTLSHTSAFERDDIDFVWHPPNEDHGDIIITGSIARTKYIFWAVQSVIISGETGGDGGDGGSGTSQCTPSSILITTVSLLLYLSSLLSHHTHP